MTLLALSLSTFIKKLFYHLLFSSPGLYPLPIILNGKTTSLRDMVCSTREATFNWRDRKENSPALKKKKPSHEQCIHEEYIHLKISLKKKVPKS